MRAAALPRRRLRGALGGRLRRWAWSARWCLGWALDASGGSWGIAWVTLGIGARARADHDVQARKAVKPFSEARRAQPRADPGCLENNFPKQNRVLEIGSGPASTPPTSHPSCRTCVWQASDRGGEPWPTSGSGGKPIELDVDKPFPKVDADAVFTANTCHIMSWPQVERMFAGSRRACASVKDVLPLRAVQLWRQAHPESNAPLRCDAVRRAIAASGISRRGGDFRPGRRRAASRLAEDQCDAGQQPPARLSSRLTMMCAGT